MHLGAVVEFAVVLTIVATLGDVKASILVRNRGYTRAQWHAEITAGGLPGMWPGGLKLVNRLWVARKAHQVLRAAPGLR